MPSTLERIRKPTGLWLAPLVVALLLQPLACSSGGGGDGEGNTPPPVTDGVSPLVVEQALRASFGGRSLKVLFLAMEAGYSADQIALGAIEQRIGTSGDILTAEGSIEAPAFEPSLNLVRSTPMPTGRVVTLIDFLMDTTRERAESLGNSAIVLILGMLAIGFSPDQIIEMLIIGTVETNANGRLEIRDENGRRYLPSRDPSDDLWGVDDDLFQPDAVSPPSLSAPECPGGSRFVCPGGPVLCAEQVCNGRADCSDGSDEAAERCGDDRSCCVVTAGCPTETGTSCGDGCCCCPGGQACDQQNPRNGCIPAP